MLIASIGTTCTSGMGRSSVLRDGPSGKAGLCLDHEFVKKKMWLSLLISQRKSPDYGIYRRI